MRVTLFRERILIALLSLVGAVPGSQTHYQVESLLSGSKDSTTAQQTTFYEIWVTAANRAGVGDKSKVIRFSPNSKGEIQMKFEMI
jgi:hypothetical protein